MTGLHRLGFLFVVVAALSACKVDELGNIQCESNANCPLDYPTCSSSTHRCVAAAAPDRLVAVGQSPPSAVSGRQLEQPLVVRVNDVNGNPVESFTVDWTASPGASVSASSTTTGLDGTTKVFATLNTKNGTNTFTATGHGLNSAPITFTATGVSGPATQIKLVSGDGQTKTVATNLDALSVEVDDANGNPVEGQDVTWTVTAGGGQINTTSKTDANGISTAIATLGQIKGTNAFTASASLAGTPLTGSPVAFGATGTPDVAASFDVAFPDDVVGAVVAGEPHRLTVTARDRFGNQAEGYRGTIHFTTTNDRANVGTSLPVPDYTFTATDAGKHPFSGVSLGKAGSNFSIVATDTVRTTVTGSQSSITVAPAATDHFDVAPQAPFTAGVAFDVIVTAKDHFGNTQPGYGGTVNVSATESATILASGKLTSNGANTFQLTLTVAENQTIRAQDASVPATFGSASVTIQPASANHFTVVPSSLSITAGDTISADVTPRDAFGNVDTNYNHQVVLTSTDAQLSPISLVVAGATTTFNGIVLTTAGSQTLTATQSGASAPKGTSAAITVSAGSASKLVLSGFPNPAVAGAPGSITVSATDAYGNAAPIPADTTVHFDATDADRTLPADYKFLPADNGSKTFAAAVILNTIATSSITVSAAGFSDGVEAGVNVGAGPRLFSLTATLISGGSRAGMVFIAGGTTTAGGTTGTKSTWIFNPTTGEIVPGPQLVVARYAHTATAISGGRIVIAGGPNATGDKEWEVCTTDTTLTCTAYGSQLNRCNAAAAVLVSNKVIIGGGDDCATTSPTVFNTTEILDATGPTPALVPPSGKTPLNSARHFHTATSLTSGKVLFAGGESAGKYEVYIQGTPSMSVQSNLAAARSNHTATPLPLGSTACSATGACVLLAGGTSTATTTWEVFDLTQNKITAKGGGTAAELQTPRSRHVAGAFTGSSTSGKVVVTGGIDSTSATLTSTESFDANATTPGFQTVTASPLTTARTQAAAVYVPAQDLLFVFGGSSSGYFTEQVHP